MPEAAFVSWLVYFVLAFGVRVIVQLRTTGRTGLVSLRRSTPLERVAGAAFVASLAIGWASTVLPLARPDVALWRPWQLPAALYAVGGVAYIAGVAITFVAQLAMGRSWRIGVDANEPTELVVHGLFRFVRNPIFSGMLLTVAGLAVVCSSWLSWFACIALLSSLELQVRGVEEPYLTRIHGDAYRTYAAAVGRFVPGVGKGARHAR